ncbi:MAG: thioredoxin family protein [Gammaproteobacteria bacterium]|nr:MAG: thioredoxin family protein [Gammaproteobacteria bacterium]
MEDELRPFVEKYSIVVHRQFIDNDPELEQRYGNKVPVLTVDGVTLCAYFLDPDKLLTKLNNAD